MSGLLKSCFILFLGGGENPAKRGKRVATKCRALQITKFRAVPRFVLKVGKAFTPIAAIHFVFKRICRRFF